MKRETLSWGFVVATMIVAVLPAAAGAADYGDCGDPFTPIYEIQGDGDESPFHGDEEVTEGVVTVDLQASSELSGFFIQDRRGDKDPATSDGIFVNHRDYRTPLFDPDVGDYVRVRGTVAEQYGQTQIE